MELSLPLEIIFRIFNFLEFLDRVRAGGACYLFLEARRYFHPDKTLADDKWNEVEKRLINKSLWPEKDWMKIDILAKNYQTHWGPFINTGKTLLQFLKTRPASFEIHDNRFAWNVLLFGLPSDKCFIHVPSILERVPGA